MKAILALTFAGAGFIAGLRAAWLWWRASAEKPTISGNLDAWRNIQDTEWIAALLTAAQASGKLNGQAAMWTTLGSSGGWRRGAAARQADRQLDRQALRTARSQGG
jgi:hypothetical protein